jgi:hypothetical protein
VQSVGLGETRCRQLSVVTDLAPLRPIIFMNVGAIANFSNNQQFRVGAVARCSGSFSLTLSISPLSSSVSRTTPGPGT